MRRLTAWIGGVAGGVAAYRLWRRHGQPEPAPSTAPPPGEPDDRADELRTKLAETRATEPVAEETAAEPATGEEAESPEDRRRRVHDEGRVTLDQMKSDERNGAA
jgi:hypothetical protein